MTTRMFLGGAIALSLTFAVGSASAVDIQMYGATFESDVSTTSGELNDWAYELGIGVTTYADTTGEHYGWLGGVDDASTIIAANGGRVLQVDTGSSTLTDKLASSVTDRLNPSGTNGQTFCPTLPVNMIGKADVGKCLAGDNSPWQLSPCPLNAAQFVPGEIGNAAAFLI